MEREKIERINQLAKKAKAEGLTDAEKAEQAQLRGEYLAEWRKGLLDTLENTYIVDETSKHKLKRKDEK